MNETTTSPAKTIDAIGDRLGEIFPGTDVSVSIEKHSHCGGPVDTRYVQITATLGGATGYVDPEVDLVGYVDPAGRMSRIEFTRLWESDHSGLTRLRVPDCTVEALLTGFDDHARTLIRQAARQEFLDTNINTAIRSGGGRSNSYLEADEEHLVVTAPGGGPMVKLDMSRKQARWAPQVRPMGLFGMVSVASQDRGKVLESLGRELLMAQDRFDEIGGQGSGKVYIDGLIEQVRQVGSI